jgi:hypothetical protein
MCLFTSVKEKEMSTDEDEPGRAVGTATRYGVDGPGIEWRWRRDFPHPSSPAPLAHPASCSLCTGSPSRGYSGRFFTLTTHHHQAPRLKKG